jgi:hypothetical protein
LHYKDYGNEDDVMCRYLGHVAVKRNAYDTLVQYLKEVDHLEDVAAGNEMILNWILKVQVGRLQM